MLNGNKSVSSEVLVYWLDNYLLNEKVGPFEKRLFDWWIEEGFFCVSNFKQTKLGVSAELMLLLGGSVYDVAGAESSEESEKALKDSAKRKIDDGWDLILKIKPNYYIVEDTENNRQKIKELLSDNIRRFEVLNYITKQDGEKTIIKSVVINVYRNR